MWYAVGFIAVIVILTAILAVDRYRHKNDETSYDPDSAQHFADVEAERARATAYSRGNANHGTFF